MHVYRGISAVPPERSARIQSEPHSEWTVHLHRALDAAVSGEESSFQHHDVVIIGDLETGVVHPDGSVVYGRDREAPNRIRALAVLGTPAVGRRQVRRRALEDVLAAHGHVTWARRDAAMALVRGTA